MERVVGAKHCFDSDPDLYRVASEPRYRLFRSSEECWEEIKKHEPVGWLKFKSGNYKIFILDVDFTYVGLNTYEYAFNNFEFADGTPFGKRED